MYTIKYSSNWYIILSSDETDTDWNDISILKVYNMNSILDMTNFIRDITMSQYDKFWDSNMSVIMTSWHKSDAWSSRYEWLLLYERQLEEEKKYE